MRNIIDLYEASILDIEGSIEDGNKYENVDLEMIIKAKSEEEFNILYDILKDTVAAEEKEPPTKTRYKKKYITSGDDNLYIKFQIYHANRGEKKINYNWWRKDSKFYLEYFSR